MKKTLILAVILALVAGGFLINSVVAAKTPFKSAEKATDKTEMPVSCQALFTFVRWHMLHPSDGEDPNANPYAFVDYLGVGGSGPDRRVNIIDLAHFAQYRFDSGWCDSKLKWPIPPSENVN